MGFMSSPQIQLALWILQPVLQTVVALVMFRRRLQKEFPVFFALTLAQIVIFAVNFPVYFWASHATYFDVFWISGAISLVFEFKIIHEVFLDAFRPYHALQDLGTALFKWAALIMVLVSVVLISTSPNWNDPLVKTVMIAHRCVRVTQCGMVLFLLAFCKHVGLSWRRAGFGIALGFGIYAGLELLSNGLYSGEHISADAQNFINLTTSNVCIALWLAYVSLSRQQTRVPILVPQRWDEALLDVQPHGNSESLIPMFEHMVDRAFSKTQGA
jgi:hypothetical protein